MYKVIFLDIDGVLNTEHGLKTISNNWTNLSKMIDSRDDKKHFCEEAVSNLKKIIDETGAKIVISSTWRSYGLEWFKKFWKGRGLPGEIIDITPYSEHRVRGYEIEKWLHSKDSFEPKHYWDAIVFSEANDECEIESYLILDDDRDMMIDQIDHFVWTPSQFGLAGEGIAEKSIHILNNIKIN